MGTDITAATKRKKKKKENIVQNGWIEKPKTHCKSCSGVEGGSGTAYPR